MKRMIFTACMAIAFLTASAQSNPYIVKTKGVKKSAQTHMQEELAEAQQEEEEASQDFISQNFKFHSLCDWEKGMKFMVMPEKYDLVVKTFTDASTEKEVSSMTLKYKIMVYQGHDESKDGHARINFICQDNGKPYYYEIGYGTFDDYCFQKTGVPTLAYLGDVDIAKEKLMDKTLYTKTKYYRIDTEFDGEGYQDVEVDKDMEVKVVAVGVGSRKYPVKIIVEDKNGNQFFQNVTMSKTNCGMRDDEFVADEARYLFYNSFELQDDIMSISSKNYKQFIGKVVHTKFPTKMLNEVTSKQQAIPRLAEYSIESITPHKNDDMATVKLKNTTLGNYFYAECYLDQYKCVNEPEQFFGAIFAPGPGKKVVTSEASRAMIRAGHVGIGMSEGEVEMAAGEADKVEPGQGGHYFWIFKRSNDKLLYVEFDGSGVVKKTSVKDANGGAAKKSNGKAKAKKVTKPEKPSKEREGWLNGEATPIDM
ncbi:hypothetical protein [Xylanibacter ruminicola]|uniref:Uncharacterized protein n=1 Tax=Xylanibacter ruminicola TaxID=839 RepID=A0A1M6VQ47_XYLRU|nr:hypothetical protein [Xylanibacter ruminicola]SHK83461.1 hypothetical protein SAMN05216463_11389 [Xylanibacter ruminicola]